MRLLEGSWVVMSRVAMQAMSMFALLLLAPVTSTHEPTRKILGPWRLI